MKVEKEAQIWKRTDSEEKVKKTENEKNWIVKETKRRYNTEGGTELKIVAVLKR